MFELGTILWWASKSETAFPKRYLESPPSPLPIHLPAIPPPSHTILVRLSTFHHHVPTPNQYMYCKRCQSKWYGGDPGLIHMAKLCTWISKHGHQVFYSSSMHIKYGYIVSSQFVVISLFTNYSLVPKFSCVGEPEDIQNYTDQYTSWYL